MDKKDTICPVCGQHFFEFSDDYDICPICGWENDGVQREDEDFWGGANNLSVNDTILLRSLLQDGTTEGKASELKVQYEQKRKAIHAQYRAIDHRTPEGEKCRMAFQQAHDELIIQLDILSETRKT